LKPSEKEKEKTKINIFQQNKERYKYEPSSAAFQQQLAQVSKQSDSVAKQEIMTFNKKQDGASPSQTQG
jgi:hypothetical protein